MLCGWHISLGAMGGLGGVGKRRRRVSCAEAKGLHERAPQRARALEHELFAEEVLTGWRETVGWCWRSGANGEVWAVPARENREGGWYGGRGGERGTERVSERVWDQVRSRRAWPQSVVHGDSGRGDRGSSIVWACARTLCTQGSRCLQLVQTGRRDRATRHGAPPRCGPEPAQLAVALAAGHGCDAGRTARQVDSSLESAR